MSGTTEQPSPSPEFNEKKLILPDSRARETKRRVFTPMGVMIPFFCANCGKECGTCPEESMTFLFYLCTPCFETHGHLTHYFVMPDEVFFEKLKQEQLAAHGRFLTEKELLAVVAEDASPLATLLKQGR